MRPGRQVAVCIHAERFFFDTFQPAGQRHASSVHKCAEALIEYLAQIETPRLEFYHKRVRCALLSKGGLQENFLARALSNDIMADRGSRNQSGLDSV